MNPEPPQLVKWSRIPNVGLAYSTLSSTDLVREQAMLALRTLSLLPLSPGSEVARDNPNLGEE